MLSAPEQLKEGVNLALVVWKFHEMRLESYKEGWRGRAMKPLVSIFHFKRTDAVGNRGLEKGMVLQYSG